MNIISGLYKGRKIAMPRDIRPTSNKAREALFNILGNKLVGAAVLDLFAGSGSLGLEALSRGAASAVFCDNDVKCVNIIKKNIKALGISSGIKVIQLDAEQAVARLCGKAKFDIIFMDPPYFSARGGSLPVRQAGTFGGKEWIKKILINIDQYDILNEFGLCICEHHKKEALPEKIGRFFRFREARYGDTILSFYKIVH